MDVYPPLFRPLLKLTRTTFRSILKAYHSHFLIHSCSSDWTYGCSWPFRILFSTTLLLYKLDTLLLKQKNFPVLDITGFFFPHSYSGDDLGAMHSEKRNPCYPIRAASFVSILLYLSHKYMTTLCHDLVPTNTQMHDHSLSWLGTP